MISQENQYAGKKTVVLGLGRSGLAAARLLLRCGAEVTVCDSGESELISERAEILRKEGALVINGAGADTDPTAYELGILSPGIEESTMLVENVVAKGTQLIGEMELAFSLCLWPVVAITGSNGKTTTTELCTHMLKGAGLRAASCGNIGTPMSELIYAGEAWDVLIAEVSSFQLETIKTFHPKIALWLNLSPNHLDRYPSMREYRQAKLRIFEHQQENDWAVVPYENDLPKLKARLLTFSTTSPDSDLSLRGTEIHYQGNCLIDLSRTRLRGSHNAANAMAALAAGIALGADLGKMSRAAMDYVPPPHRCEYVATKGGMRWINDSKATNLDAMKQAICSIEGPVILIAGGKDKGFEFAPIALFVREHVIKALLIGEMRHRIARDWVGTNSIPVSSLEEAVKLAWEKGAPGTTVLFSPGTSSFDMFSNYIQRGEIYRRLVEALPQ